MDKEITNNIRYTAAVAVVRDTYPIISDIVDNAPVKTDVQYWKDVKLPKAFQGNAMPYASSAPSHLSLNESNHLQHKEASKDKSLVQPTGPRDVYKGTTDVKDIDYVSKDKIWKQTVNTEHTAVKKWDVNWSYLTSFDPKGCPREKEPLPDNYERFPKVAIPHTNSGNYGARINTEVGQKIASLEFQLSKGNRKHKLDSDMICY